MKQAAEKEPNKTPQHNSENKTRPKPSPATINTLGGERCAQVYKYEIQEFDERHERSFVLSMHVEKTIQQKHARGSDKH